MASPKGRSAKTAFTDVASLEAAIASQSKDNEFLSAIAASAALHEDLALTFLKRRDLPHAVLEALAKNGRAVKSRKVKCAVVEHPRTPRHVSLPLMRHMYTFELMQLSLLPGVAADLKLALEDVLVGRVSTLTAGERLTLAKRSSGRVAAALLQDSDKRVIEAGLNNPYLTEALVVKALLQPKSSELLALHVCHHQKWSTRKDVHIAALRNEFTPFASAIRFAEKLPLDLLRDIFRHSALPGKIKTYLLEVAEQREFRKRGREAT
ncbi:MAG TPA: hypothetical protein VMZ25_09575 [Terriglobales bacterium]|nr:hypothetical protein [Terriglobales bacterium]